MKQLHSAIILCILLVGHQQTVAEKGNGLIGKPAPDWKKLRWINSHPLQPNNFTNKVPLQVNQIDGNALNHRPENLELICPNCHSLTETYGYTGARVSARRGQRKQQYSNLARP